MSVLGWSVRGEGCFWLEGGHPRDKGEAFLGPLEQPLRTLPAEKDTYKQLYVCECRGQNNAPPRRYLHPSPQTLWTWYLSWPKGLCRWRDLLNYPAGPKVITRVLLRDRQGVRGREDAVVEAEWWAVEVEEGTTSQGSQGRQGHGFSRSLQTSWGCASTLIWPAGPLTQFGVWLPEPYNNKSVFLKHHTVVTAIVNEYSDFSRTWYT